MTQPHIKDTMYARMNFPAYKFVEYPKWVGDRVVNSQAEELAIIQGQTVEPSVTEERDELAKLVESKDKELAAVRQLTEVERQELEELRKFRQAHAKPVVSAQK